MKNKHWAWILWFLIAFLAIQLFIMTGWAEEAFADAPIPKVSWRWANDGAAGDTLLQVSHDRTDTTGSIYKKGDTLFVNAVGAGLKFTTASGGIIFLDDSVRCTISLEADSLNANHIVINDYQLPTADGTASYVLTTAGDGTTSWQAAPGASGGDDAFLNLMAGGADIDIAAFTLAGYRSVGAGRDTVFPWIDSSKIGPIVRDTAGELYLAKAGGTMAGAINMANNTINNADSIKTGAVNVTRLWGPAGTILLYDGIQAQLDAGLVNVNDSGIISGFDEVEADTGTFGLTVTDSIETELIDMSGNINMGSNDILGIDSVHGATFYGDQIVSGGAIYLDENGSADDAILYFHEVTKVGKSLRWDATDKRFEFSDSVWVNGKLIITGDITEGGVPVIVEGDNVTLLDGANPWRLFYSNVTGDVTEIDLGTINQVLTSGGAGAAPGFANAPTGIFTEVDATLDTIYWLAPNGDTCFVVVSDAAGNVTITLGNESDNSTQTMTIDGGGVRTWLFNDTILAGDSTDDNDIVMYFRTSADSGAIQYDVGTNKMQYSNNGGVSWNDMGSGAGSGTQDSTYINVGGATQYGPFTNDMYKIKEGTGVDITRDDSSTYDVFNIATTLGTSVDVTSEITGVLPTANGGTGNSSEQDPTLIDDDSVTIGDGTGTNQPCSLVFDPDAGTPGYLMYAGLGDSFIFSNDVKINGNILLSGMIDPDRVGSVAKSEDNRVDSNYLAQIVHSAVRDASDNVITTTYATIANFPDSASWYIYTGTDAVDTIGFKPEDSICLLIYPDTSLGTDGYDTMNISTPLGKVIKFQSDDVFMIGDLHIQGDDIYMGTNTAGFLLVGDATNYNPVAMSGDATLASNGAIDVTIETSDITTQTIVNDDIDTTSENFVFDGAFHITSTEADSAYVTANTINDSLALTLRLAGGTMGGAIAMVDNNITDVGTITSDGGAGEIIEGFDEVETDTITVNSVPIKDFEGTGLTVTSGVLAADLGTAIVTGDITDQTIINADMDTTSENFVFDGAFHINSNEADSAYVTANTVGDTADALRNGDTWTGTHDYTGATVINVDSIASVHLTAVEIKGDSIMMDSARFKTLEIMPTATIAGIHYDGIRIDGSALDPSAVDATIHGLDIDFGGVDETNNPELEGIHITVPQMGDHSIHTNGTIFMEGDATTSAAGENRTFIEAEIDVTGSTGGFASIIEATLLGEILGSTAEGVVVASFGPIQMINQHSGTYRQPDQAGADAECGEWDSSGTDFVAGLDAVTVFDADNDAIFIGNADSVFSAVEIIFSSNADEGKSIQPTFWYATTTTAWTQFIPVDGTDGCEEDGAITFEADDLTGWADVDISQDDAEHDECYWIKIVRTRNGSPGTITISTLKTLTGIKYAWDGTGDLSVDTVACNALDLGGNVLTTKTGTGSIVLNSGPTIASAILTGVIDASGASSLTGPITMTANAGSIIGLDSLDIDSGVYIGDQLEVTGNIIVGGTVDGVDIAALDAEEDSIALWGNAGKATDSVEVWDNRSYHDASVTEKGIASFDATDFSDASGNITIDDDGHAHTTASLSAIDTSDISPAPMGKFIRDSSNAQPHSAQAVIIDPDNLPASEDTVMVLRVTADEFPSGITIRHIKLSCRPVAPSDYVVDFWEFTENDATGTETIIETASAIKVASAAREGEDDGTLSNAGIAAGNYIMAILPATDVEQLQITVIYTID